MTHVALIKAIKADYKRMFEENPADSEREDGFQKGVIFAYDYLLAIIKNGGSWVYERKGK